MKLFKRNRNRQAVQKISDQAAVCIAKTLLRAQQKTAARLARMTRSWKPRQQRIFLVLVCTVFGCCSSYVLLQPFIKPVPAFVKPASISLPNAIQNIQEHLPKNKTNDK